MDSTYIFQLILFGLAILSLPFPWVALAALIALQLLGSVIPGLSGIRGLSVIAVFGLIGVTRFIVKDGLKVRFLWPLFLLSAFFISALFSIGGYEDMRYFCPVLGGVGAYYLAYFSIRNRKQASLVIWIAIITSLIAAVVSIHEFKIGSFLLGSPLSMSQDIEFYSSSLHGMKKMLFENPNYLITFLFPGMVFAVTLHSAVSGRSYRTILFTFIFIMLVGIFATISRGSIVIVAVFFGLLFILNRGDRLKQKIFIGIMVSFGIIATYFFLPYIFTLVSTRFASLQAETSRTALMQTGWNLFLFSPLFGAGPGSIYRVTGGSASHCGYTGLLGECGLLGFVFYYAILLHIMKKLFNARRKAVLSGDYPASIPVYSVFFSLMGAILTLNLFHEGYYLYNLWILIAVGQLMAEASNGTGSKSAHAVLDFLCQSARNSGTAEKRQEVAK